MCIPTPAILHRATTDSSFLQLQQRDFRRTIEPDRRRDEADASADVHVCIAAREQAVCVFRSVLRRHMRRAEEGNDHLAAVRMTGQNQMRPLPRPIFKGIGIVHQHQREWRVNVLKGAPDVDPVRPEVTETDDSQRLTINASAKRLSKRRGIAPLSRASRQCQLSDDPKNPRF